MAVSRAEALTVFVAAPALLTAPVHSPEQLRQVSASCRYVEHDPEPGPEVLAEVEDRIASGEAMRSTVADLFEGATRGESGA